jgi:sugar diacid utilization regulator
VSRGEETVWGWLGGKRRLAVADIERLLQTGAGVSLAVGEPGKGVDGWRRTHRQAQAALLVALRSRKRLTRYSDVALLAAALRDDVLARWLIETFLSPLDSQRDRGAALRETLRCYFAAGRNVSKVAVELGVKRQTVEQRRQTVEQVLGRELPTCLAEMEAALRLEELGPRSEAAAEW